MKTYDQSHSGGAAVSEAELYRLKLKVISLRIMAVADYLNSLRVVRKDSRAQKYLNALMEEIEAELTEGVKGE